MLVFGVLWLATLFGLHLSFPARHPGVVALAQAADDPPGTKAFSAAALLTPRQQQWLSQHDGQIRIGITVIPPQVLRVDEQYKGLCIDYIRLMERRLGCRFKLVAFDTWRDVMQAAKTHRIDMIFAAQQTPERTEYLLFTRPYIELPNMIVVRNDRKGGTALKDMNGWRVATSQASAVHEFLIRQYPDLKLTPVPNELSGLIKVSDGEVDAMVVEISRASYYIEKAGILNLRVSGSAGLLYQLRFAVRKDWPVLVGILDKGLAAISDEERQDISRRWIMVDERGMIAGKRLWIALGSVTAAIVLIALAMVFWNRTLRRIVRQRTLQLQQELAERRQAEDALRQSEERYRRIVDTASEGIWVLGLDTRTVFVNARLTEMLGYDTAEMIGRPFTDFMFEEDVADHQRRMEARRQGLSENYERRFRRKGEGVVWAQISASPILDESGRFQGSFGMLTDITNRKQAESGLLRLNRQLRAISTCNQVLMQATDEQGLLEEICSIVCEVAGYRMAWVGYRQDDDAKTINPVAWAGIEEGYLSQVRITWDDTIHGQGPSGQAIRQGCSACIQDFATDPLAEPWRQSALKRGYRSSTALPLKDENGTAFGVLCIYSVLPDTFSPEEMKLLDELAGNLAFGIITLRMRAEHKKAEMQILASEQLFRALVENSPDFIARYDRKFRRIYFNPAIQKLFGVQAQDALGLTPADQSPIYAPQVYIDHLQHVIETATESTAEIPFRTNWGEMHWGHIRFVPEFGSDGRVATVLAIGRDIHEIKENEQRFRMLAENFPDFVIRFDRDGHCTYINPAVEKAFGMPPDAITGKTLREITQGLAPERNDVLITRIRQAFDKGVANESEMSWDIGTGERVFEIRIAPEKDATGNVVSVLSIARDITERKRMEQDRLAHLRFFENMDRVNRVIQSAENLESMMKDLLDTVLAAFECDRASLVYPCDPMATAWQARMERTRPEWPGAHALCLEVPMDPDVARIYKTILDSNTPVGFGPGNEHPLPADVACQFDEQSQLAIAIYPKVDKPYMFVIHQCSRQRTWTQNEKTLFKEVGRRLGDALTSLLMHRNLQESELRYRQVFENSPVSIWEEDLSRVKDFFDGLRREGVNDIETYFAQHPETIQQCAELTRIEDVNQAALSLLGAADKDELLSNIAVTFTPDSFDAFRQELISLWKGSIEMSSDTVVRTLAKDIRNVTMYFSVCPGFEKTLSKVLVSLVDVTERMQSERELALYRDNLEDLVRERTAELKAANKELESFAYSVSHDLRAPLRHIDGFLELLRENLGTSLDALGRRYIATITDAVWKMGHLIDNLLSFSRMGRKAMSHQQVALDDLVNNVIQGLEPDSAGRDIAWRIGKLPTVSCDRDMLRMVLDNLISNALKFTKFRQQARIEIGANCDRGSEAVVFVRDNGAGFDMAYAGKLFGVFQRLHHADEYEGTGIGLANVHRIITRHGGRIWAEGEPEQGATFYFSLPLKLHADADEKP